MDSIYFQPHMYSIHIFGIICIYIWYKHYILCKINIHFGYVHIYVYVHILRYFQPWQQTKKTSPGFNLHVLNFPGKPQPSIARTMAFNIAQLMSWAQQVGEPQLALKGNMSSFPGGYTQDTQVRLAGKLAGKYTIHGPIYLLWLFFFTPPKFNSEFTPEQWWWERKTIRLSGEFPPFRWCLPQQKEGGSSSKHQISGANSYFQGGCIYCFTTYWIYS